MMGKEIEVTLDEIREDAVVNANQQKLSVMILKEKGLDRYLPIAIGASQLESIFLSESIVIGQRGSPYAAPLTHDLISIILRASGSELKRVEILFGDERYWAHLLISSPTGDHEIVCRPGDAVAIAVRVNAPIFIDEALMERLGTRLDPETGKPI